MENTQLSYDFLEYQQRSFLNIQDNINKLSEEEVRRRLALILSDFELIPRKLNEKSSDLVTTNFTVKAYPISSVNSANNLETWPFHVEFNIGELRDWWAYCECTSPSGCNHRRRGTSSVTVSFDQTRPGPYNDTNMGMVASIQAYDTEYWGTGPHVWDNLPQNWRDWRRGFNFFLNFNGVPPRIETQVLSNVVSNGVLTFASVLFVRLYPNTAPPPSLPYGVWLVDIEIDGLGSSWFECGQDINIVFKY